MTNQGFGIGPGFERLTRIYRAGAFGTRPSVPTDFAELERRAKAVSSAKGWAYVAGGAGEGVTMRRNREAFERHPIVPRMLRGTAERDLTTTVLGTALPAPMLLAPVGAADLLHRDADLATAAAARATGIPYVLSNQGCAPMEDVAEAMGDTPRWMQLYWSKDELLVDSLIARAEKMGAGALVLTVDTTMIGWRPQDLNLGSLPFAQGIGIAQYTSDPRFREIVRERLSAITTQTPTPRQIPAALRTLVSLARRHPGRLLDNLRSAEPRAAATTFTDIYANPALSWDHLATLRGRTTLPIVVKGLLHPDDARRALDLGVDAIVVSNHGGRQVDNSIASLDALVSIRAAVGREPTLLLDSGIRTGSDVFVALALGADAVLLGRPYVYGLALAGATGAEEVIRNVIAEFDLTMALAGTRTIADIDADALAG